MSPRAAQGPRAPRFIALCATLALLAGGAARAENASVQERAHQSFLDGQQAFNAGRYADALQAFQASFALSARPELLLTLAQTTRKLGRYEEAITYCERYLAGDVPPANARSAREFLQQLRVESAAAHASGTPPPPVPAPAATPAPPPLLVVPAPVAPSPAPVAVTASAPPPASKRRALAIGLGVAGGVVVAAVAITLGVVLSTPSNRYPSSPLGTVPFDH